MGKTKGWFEALIQGDRESIEEMLEQEPELMNARDSNGVSSVLTALYNNHPELVQLLIEDCVQLDIFEAAATGEVECLKNLLTSSPELVNAYSVDGFQPLGLAIFFGRPTAAKFLLEHGAEVNSPSHNHLQVSPIHSAVASQNVELVRLVLDHGADANALQTGNFTALHGAAQIGSEEMINLLLEHGANPNARTINEQTPLTIAHAEGHKKAVELLRSHGGRG